MRNNIASRFLLAAALLCTPRLPAQSAQFSSLQPSLASSVPSALSATAAAEAGNPASAAALFSPVTATAVANRARTLGNTPSGSGTRYFAATDLDLRNLTPRQVLDRLSPKPVSARDGVRHLDIYVDLKRPLLVDVQPGQSVNIGSAEIKAEGIRDVEVHASIFLSGIDALNK